MSVESKLSHDDEDLLIYISGRFDFTLANDFLNSYRNFPIKQKYVIDLSNVEFMDSAAIGMLLLLREFTDGKAIIKIVRCSDDIKKVIAMSHIDRFIEMGH